MRADPQLLDDRRTSAEIAAAHPRIALLPLGATEQHGAHLPCGTDTFQVSYLADAIARAYPEPVWRLPTIPITVSHMHRGSPGTVWLTNGTLAAVVKDIVHALRQEGITKVVILNGHGGNFVVRPIVQDLNRDHADLQVILAEPPAGERVFEEPPGSIHAGESETSRMLHVAPDLVHLDLAVSTDVPYTQSFLLYAPITRLEPSGVWGHARAATPEKGRRYYEQHVPAAVEAIRRTFAALDALAPAGGGESRPGDGPAARPARRRRGPAGGGDRMGTGREDGGPMVECVRAASCGTAARRRAVLLAGGGAGALLATACGPGQTASPPAAERKPVTVSYMSLGDAASDRVAQERALFENYQRESGGITINLEATGSSNWGALKEKFIIRATGGDPADLVMNNWGTWSDMSEGGMLTELTPFLKRDKIGYDLYLPSAIESHTADGKLWGMPVSMSVDAMAYNVDLLEAAGLKPPPVDPNDKTWTMERFLEYAQKLTRPGEQYGFGGAYSGFATVGVADGTFFGRLAWDDKQRKCLMDTAEFRTGLQYWNDLAHRYHVQPDAQEQTALRGGLTGNIFLTGKIGLQGTLSPFPKSQTPFRWALATLPYSGSGPNVSSRMWATALPMGRTPRTEAAWDFLRWTTRPENGGQFPYTAGHAVSPLVKGGSDIAQKRMQQDAGIDPRAFLLQAQSSPVSGGGLLKYATWGKAVEELTPRYTDFRANKLGTTDYARAATEVFDRLMGARK